MSGVINSSDYVVLQKLGGEHIRVMKLSTKQKVLIEKLKFNANTVFGKPFGLFEVANDTASSVKMEHLLKTDKSSNDLEVRGECLPPSNAMNEADENSEQTGQMLSQDDVIGLKSKLSAGELVAKLVEGNKGFENRTEYSKSKYIRRKTKKHSDRVLILKPTIRLLCQSYYNKDSERLSNLRIDQLGLILQMANIHYGSNVLVFEQALGLATAAVIERLAGNGCCIHLHRGIIAQSIPCVHAMNFPEDILSTFCPVRIAKLTAVEQNDPQIKGEFMNDMMNEDEEEMSKSAVTKIDRLSTERKGLFLMDSGVDSLLIVARSVSIISVLEIALKSLRPSGSIAIYSPHLTGLMEAQAWLMERSCVNVNLSNQMYRCQQVLPNRTHPLMAQSVVGGYVLSAIKVIN